MAFPTNCNKIPQRKFICKLISDQPYENLDTCQLCGAVLYDFFTHVTCSCSVTYAIRNSWWTEISNLFSVYLCSELCALSYDDLFLILLGHKTCAHLDVNDASNFQKLNYHLVLDCASLYYWTLSRVVRQQGQQLEQISEIYLFIYFVCRYIYLYID